jgi:hypothetical protein
VADLHRRASQSFADNDDLARLPVLEPDWRCRDAGREARYRDGQAFAYGSWRGHESLTDAVYGANRNNLT